MTTWEEKAQSTKVRDSLGWAVYGLWLTVDNARSEIESQFFCFQGPGLMDGWKDSRDLESLPNSSNTTS